MLFYFNDFIDKTVNEKKLSHVFKNVFELNGFFPYRSFIYSRFNLHDVQKMTKILNSQFSINEILNIIEEVYNRDVKINFSITKTFKNFYKLLLNQSPDINLNFLKKDVRRKFLNKKDFLKRFRIEYSKMNKEKLKKQILSDIKEFSNVN
jgi:hypothetical protein